MSLSISLVTPSLNQRAYLEEAIESVLNQRYPELEYVVADGGSTDGSADLIERYTNRLTRWWSAPDAGHADALNRAFETTSGELMGWLNSDDRLFPGALRVVAEIFDALPEVQWLTSAFPAWLDEQGRTVLVNHVRGYSREAFMLGLHGAIHGPRRFAFIQQESTFWRRSLWELAGRRLDPSVEPAADFELWARFFDHAELYAVDTVIGAFRSHAAQRTATELHAYTERAREVLARRGGGRVTPVRGLALRAQRIVPAGDRVPVGWLVPCVRWDRAARSWVVGQRRLR